MKKIAFLLLLLLASGMSFSDNYCSKVYIQEIQNISSNEVRLTLEPIGNYTKYFKFYYDHSSNSTALDLFKIAFTANLPVSFSYKALNDDKEVTNWTVACNGTAFSDLEGYGRITSGITISNK